MSELHYILEYLDQHGHLVGAVVVAIFVRHKWAVFPHRPMLEPCVRAFLFFCCLPQIIQLIMAVLLGNTAYLPSSWHKYVTLAIIVVIVLGIDEYRSRTNRNPPP